jgi:hypothetical protein
VGFLVEDFSRKEKGVLTEQNLFLLETSNQNIHLLEEGYCLMVSKINVHTRNHQQKYSSVSRGSEKLSGGGRRRASPFMGVDLSGVGGCKILIFLQG